MRVSLFLLYTNGLIVTPTYDAYLDNGTDIGLTVGIIILAYAVGFVKLHQADQEGKEKMLFNMPASCSFSSWGP